MRKSLALAVLSFLSLPAYLFAQPKISYLLPDIGSTALNTYVEILGPTDYKGNFGADGFYLNNAGDDIRVELARPADSEKVVIGPVVISWDGRMISTQIFVLPNVISNSKDWESLSDEDRIPIRVRVGKLISNVDSFYIVQSAGVISPKSNQVLGSGGALGKRSRRGAMIVDQLIMPSSGIVRCSMKDTDPRTEGNQAYLPFVLIARDGIAAGGSQLSVSGLGRNGGPGGGGGGGIFNDGWSGGKTSEGGAGFTGGQGNPVNAGGMGSGGVGLITSEGGISLNAVLGPTDLLGSDTWFGALGGQGAGGGTGFPFGVSGRGNRASQCNPRGTQGGYGGGGGASECYPVAFGGGGAGYATEGTGAGTTGGGAGHVYGNPEIVPLAGGSGGAGGNPWYGQSGQGGGGGGALGIYSMKGGDFRLVSDGVRGEDQEFQELGHWSGAGGGGSGGGIAFGGKLPISFDTVSANGGASGIAQNPHDPGRPSLQDGGNGGQGRIRIDGEVRSYGRIVAGSLFHGLSTDTSSFVKREFVLTGTGSSNSVTLYLWSRAEGWKEYSSPAVSGSKWKADMRLLGQDTIFLVVASQTTSPVSNTEYANSPEAIFSQTAANILRTEGTCVDGQTYGYSTELYKVKIKDTLTVPLSIGFSGTARIDSVSKNAVSLRLSLLISDANAEVLSVTPPSGWKLTSFQLKLGVLTIDLENAGGSLHTNDTLGYLRIAIRSSAADYFVMTLQSVTLNTLTESHSYCVSSFEGSGWFFIRIPENSVRGSESNSPLQCYPIPASKRLYVNRPTETLQILGLLGQDWSSRAKREEHGFNVQNLPAGSYILRALETGETLRFVVLH